jgi:hypothetical protein
MTASWIKPQEKYSTFLRGPTGVFYGQTAPAAAAAVDVLGQCEAKHFEKSLPQCHFIHQESLINCPHIEPEPQRWEFSDQRPETSPKTLKWRLKYTTDVFFFPYLANHNAQEASHSKLYGLWEDVAKLINKLFPVTYNYL